MHTPTLHRHSETKTKETKPPNNKQKKQNKTKRILSVEILHRMKTKYLVTMLPSSPPQRELCASGKVCKDLNLNSTFFSDLRNKVFFP